MASRSRPEVFVLLLIGVPPQTLIELGYSRSTVYGYNRRLPEVRAEITRLLRNQASAKKRTA